MNRFTYIAVSILLLLSLTLVVYIGPSKIFSLQDEESLLAMVVGMEFMIAKNWQAHGAFAEDLEEGMEGGSVELLQAFLSWNQNLLNAEHMTGYFGEETKKALMAYQAKHGLYASGIFDEATREHVNEKHFSMVCPEGSQSKPLPYDVKLGPGKALLAGYVPPGLTEISGEVPTRGIVCLEPEAKEAYLEMYADAKEDGISLMITSGYRRPEMQQLLVYYWTRLEGEDAHDEVAKPGRSEHQLGTTIDLTGESIGYDSVSDNFHDSPEWQWLMENAEDYGFILSYPEGKEKKTGYEYEPWHWRYIGEKNIKD